MLSIPMRTLIEPRDERTQPDRINSFRFDIRLRGENETPFFDD